MNEAVKVALDRFLLLADARSELEFAQYIVKMRISGHRGRHFRLIVDAVSA